MNNDYILDCYFNEVGDHELLSRDKQNELYARLDELCPDRLSLRIECMPEECEPVIAKIVGYMYKAVIHEAHRLGKIKDHIPLEELIQEGNLGLLYGIWKFDNSKNVQLNTYVVNWIRQRIRSHLSGFDYSIRFPNFAYDVAWTLSKYQYIAKNHDELIAHVMDTHASSNLTHKGIDDIMAAYKRAKSMKSLEAVMYNGSNGGVNQIVADFVPDVDSLDVADQAYNSMLKQVVERLLISDILTTREAQIVKLYYGLDELDAGRQYNLEEIGAMFELTRERVRQIKKEALNKLRDTELRDYV